jgi:hypothetical protein
MRDCLGLALRGRESGPKFVEFPRADLKSPAPRGPELKAPAAGVSLAAFGGLDLDPAKKEKIAKVIPRLLLAQVLFFCCLFAARR